MTTKEMISVVKEMYNENADSTTLELLKALEKLNDYEVNEANYLNNKWIPVDRMVPKSSGKFLVSIKGSNKAYTTVCLYNAAKADSAICNFGWELPNVRAWQERLAPYKKPEMRVNKEAVEQFKSNLVNRFMKVE